MLAKFGTNSGGITWWSNVGGGTTYNWPNLEPKQVAFYLAGEITQVKESIPWVRCASGNVYTIVHLTQSPFEELSNSDPDTVYLFVYSPNISLCNWSSFQLCQIVLDRSAQLLKYNYPLLLLHRFRFYFEH